MNNVEVKNQLRFVRQGDTLKWVNPPENTVKPVLSKVQKTSLAAIGVIGIALLVLFFMDGGTTFISMGIAELLELFNIDAAQHAYLNLR